MLIRIRRTAETETSQGLPYRDNYPCGSIPVSVALDVPAALRPLGRGAEGREAQTFCGAAPVGRTA